MKSSQTFTPWTHFRGNAALDGVGAGTVSGDLKPVWTFKTGGACLSSPVTDGAAVYIGSYDSTLYALNINTGKEIWRFKAGDEIEASPVIFGEMILIGDLNGNFFSVNKKNGNVNWQFKIRDKIAGSANVIADKNFVIFGSYDNSLYCLNAADGQLVWKYGSGSYINGTAATDGSKIVFGGCDAGLHVINAGDGTLIGKVDTESYIAGSAVIRDNFAYVGSFGKKLLGIDIVGMKIAWTYQNDTRQQPFVASPALKDSFLVAPSRDNFVHCINPADGALIWKFAAKGAVDASPVIVGDKVVAGCGAGSLYLIELTSGKLIKSFDIGGSLNGTPLVSGGMIIVGDENGLITALGVI
ncbi:MAG: PQQ-binding-like beta-propeller repeat protein [Chitinispirillia bacterium]|nr:PQQ-binding-like beta-propeller repeat protein [Chitinispirillia bacterium]MCL2241874.1 PQQ-binding-like beta-propeller repeat protein [Chitinispirillia bacterium]